MLTREEGSGARQVWSKGLRRQGLLRWPHLMPIPGPRLIHTNFASLGVRWRDLHFPQALWALVHMEVRGRLLQGPLHCWPWPPSSLWAMNIGLRREGQWFKVEAGRPSCLEVPLPIPISYFFLLMTPDCPKGKRERLHPTEHAFKTHIKSLSPRAFGTFSPVWEQYSFWQRTRP